MNKSAIRKFAVEARKKLRSSVIDKAGMMGITSEHCSDPVMKGDGFEVFSNEAGIEITLNKEQIKQRNELVNQIKKIGYEQVIEEVAYTWFNRICAIRFMEINDYLPSRVRVLSSSKNGKIEPDIVTLAPDVDLNFSLEEKDFILECKANNEMDVLFKMLFIKQCNELSNILPRLFEKTSDYSELLFDISYTNKDGIVGMLIGENGIPESDFDISAVDDDGETTGQVEIIGWLYQYYNEEKKEQVINIYKGTVKKEDIPAATQLFTTDWVVRYIVDNSIGRYWIERNKDSKLAQKLQYFIPGKVGVELVDEKCNVEEIKVFDPCQGSGHFLVYAFDVMMEIYRECGYTDRDAASLIVQNNLFGLDIDKRASQLAYFAIMMKARRYDRRFLTKGIEPCLYEIRETNGYEIDFERFESQKYIAKSLFESFKDAKEIGSLVNIRVSLDDVKKLEEKCKEIINKDYESILDLLEIKSIENCFLPIIEVAKVLLQKYETVVTNPPYLGKLEGNLKKFVWDNYKDYAGDLFSVFIYYNFNFCKQNGYSGFMTPFVWMFITSYKKLREYLIDNKGIVSLVQMEYSAFEEATVPICSFVLKNGHEQFGRYIKLTDFNGGMEVQKKYALQAIKSDVDYYFEASIDDFNIIEGKPIAYWASKAVLNDFESGKPVGEIADVKRGMTTSDNNRFLRYWAEVDYNKICFDAESHEEAYASKAIWFPYSKGGGYRKWYGYQEFLIDWENNGERVIGFAKTINKSYTRTIVNMDYYFKPSVGFCYITSGPFSMRWIPNGFLYDSGGPGMFADEDTRIRLLACMNSKPAEYLLKMISPTINLQIADVVRTPFIYDFSKDEMIKQIVYENIRLSKEDWDSYETSWNFRRHPLVRREGLLSEIYEEWKNEQENRFNQLKLNEEKLNEIFIEMYGMENELSSDVSDESISVSTPDVVRDIKSLLSYAVGCIFGRYSLEQEGVVFAGGEFSLDKYDGYTPVCDNAIIISDEDYFDNDIFGCLTKWLEQAYGSEWLKQNISFIAKNLGTSGESEREIIVNYFLNEFENEHIKLYQKRPIYWMFSSGKANGFRTLMYMHRYNSNTIGIVRTEYLHKAQKAIEQALLRSEYIRENGSGTEKAKATKNITKYTKQIAEIHVYDEAMSHIANQRVSIDLNDGVKNSYSKFQGVEVSQEGKKTQKIDLFTKIK